MNLEFQAAGKSPMNELRGAKARVESSSSPQSKGYERGAQFKNLLNQSKQDIKQADQQLAKIRENRLENESTRSTDTDVKADGVQSEELIAEEQKSAESQENSFLPTLDHAQLIGIQNFQGGIETALTQLNLKLGLEQNKAPEGLPDQGQAIIEQTDMNDQPQTLPVLESTLQFARMDNGNEVEYLAMDGISQMKGDQTEAIKAQAQAQVQLVNGVDSTDKPDLMDKADLTAKADLTDKVDLTDEADLTTKSDDLTAKTVSTDKPGLTAKADLSNMTDMTDMSKNSLAEQTKVIEVQKTPINQTENQNPGERGVQDVNLMGITANKGSEVQQNTNVEVAQQVEQKILHNFEPNKPMVLQMTLSPDNLGDIDIKLSYNQGKLIIDIMAASAETQKLLGNQINQLVRGLALQNVKVETVNLNTPVEATENGESMGSFLNDGSQFSQQQNNAPLKEQYLSKGTIQNSRFNNEIEDSNDALISLAQNLQYNSQRRINYLV